MKKKAAKKKSYAMVRFVGLLFVLGGFGLGFLGQWQTYALIQAVSLVVCGIIPLMFPKHVGNTLDVLIELIFNAV